MPILVRTTPSTMAEVADLASAGAPEGTTVIAEEQTAGRGRIGREWQSLPYAGLWLTTLLRPAVEPSSLGWLPLVTGIAVAHAVRAQTDIDVGLKWPNDIVISTSNGLAKAGGILSERLADGSVLVGIGINVSQAPDELPRVGPPWRSTPESSSASHSWSLCSESSQTVIDDGWPAPTLKVRIARCP